MKLKQKLIKLLGFDKFSYNQIIIKQSVLDDISDFAKSLAPNEFIALLEGEIRNNILFVNKLIYKQFNSSYVSAGFKPDYLPNYGYIGTAHSHPRASKPSRRDLHTFNKQQGVHLIISKPYNTNDIRCYDCYGQPLNFQIQ